MEYAPTSAGETVRSRGRSAGLYPLPPRHVARRSHVHLLLDRKTLTTAYPLLTVSGGKGAQIRLTYSEALYDKKQHKGDRNEVGDRTALGLKDSFCPTAARIASSSRCGGAPGAISISKSTPGMSR